MNRSQIKGMAKSMAGKTQETAGRATGNKSMTAKGLNRQAAGKMEKSYGDAKESVRKATRKTH